MGELTSAYWARSFALEGEALSECQGRIHETLLPEMHAAARV